MKEFKKLKYKKIFRSKIAWEHWVHGEIDSLEAH